MLQSPSDLAVPHFRPTGELKTDFSALNDEGRDAATLGFPIRIAVTAILAPSEANNSVAAMIGGRGGGRLAMSTPTGTDGTRSICAGLGV